MYTEMYEGRNTEYYGEQIWGTHDSDEDEDEVILWSKDFILKMDETDLFKEKLYNQMQISGYTGNIDNQEAALVYLKNSCSDAGVLIQPQTLKNWVVHGKASTDSRGRKNIFKLCFALRMNLGNTKDFFHKALFTRPFNYKDLYESVCCFCLNTNRRYQDVERLVRIIEGLPPQKYNNEWRSTVKIGSCIEQCRTEDELIRYWCVNSADFERQKLTATEEVMSLFEQCKDAARNYYGDDNWDYNSADKLLGAMFGINPRVVKDGIRPLCKVFSESDFPPAIKRNFPQREQIKNIKNGNATDDVLRKALIAFSFFKFFASIKEPEFEDFEDELNNRLERCGFIQLYWRNPYDWMFAFCATQEEPLIALQRLVEEFVRK